MISIRLWPLFLLSLLIAVSCGQKQDPFSGSDAGLDGESDGSPDSDKDTIVTYSNQIAPILNTHCVSCHDSGKSGPQRNNAPIGVDFDNYESARQSSQKANLRIQAGSMPPSGSLSKEEKSLFQTWLDQETPE